MLRAVRFSLVLLLALTIQTTWLADLRPFDVPGDLLLLVAIAGGLAAGPVRGATVGFIAGLALDFVLLTPFGLTALAYLGVGYVVGTVHDGVLRSAPWIPVVVTFVASLAAIIAYVILGQLVGQQFRSVDLPRVILVTSTMNALLAFPALHVMRWVEKAAPDRMMHQPVRGFR